MKLYLGGKMCDVPGFGFKAFDDAAFNIRGMGHVVFNPAERDRDTGFTPHHSASTLAYLKKVGFDRRAALWADLNWIMTQSEGMVALENWPNSPGTRAEIAAHQSIFLPVWEYLDFMELGIEAPTLNPLLPGGKNGVLAATL